MRYLIGQAISGKPEDFTLDVPDRWHICFALDAYMWRKIDEWMIGLRGSYNLQAKEPPLAGDTKLFFEINMEGRRRNLQELCDLYYKLSAWDESESTSPYGESNPIWLSSWDDKIKELLSYPPEWDNE